MASLKSVYGAGATIIARHGSAASGVPVCECESFIRKAALSLAVVPPVPISANPHNAVAWMYFKRILWFPIIDRNENLRCSPEIWNKTYLYNLFHNCRYFQF